ncbi:MAG: hypothetical protein IJL67_09555 [Oscillospiraceae bacterium]|nr:hypothetical protein [Oscillospiraceae bacterium]
MYKSKFVCYGGDENQKSKMEKGKSVIVSVVIILIILLYTLGGYIPIIGLFIARFKIYNYKNSDTVSNQAFYDFYNSKYSAGNIDYYLKRDVIIDHEVNEVECKTINQKYKNDRIHFIEQYKNTVVFPESLDICISIDGENANRWYCKVYLLGIYDNFSGSEDEVKRRMQKIIADYLNYLEPFYNVTAMQFCYANIDSAYELIVDNSKKSIDVSKLYDCFKPRNEVLDSEEYIQWKHQIESINIKKKMH